MAITTQESEKEFLEQIWGYDVPWIEEITESDVSEDEDFLYLEWSPESDVYDEFMELGNYLGARSAGTVNSGQKYVLSVEK